MTTTTPTCWHCPDCGLMLGWDAGKGHGHFNYPHSSEYESCDGKMEPFVRLVLGVDLPTTLRKAGYDVRKGSVCDVCGRLDEAVGIIGRHKDRRHDRDGYSSLEHWCENQDGRQWRKVVVVLPDEENPNEGGTP